MQICVLITSIYLQPHTGWNSIWYNIIRVTDWCQQWIW